MDRCVCVYTNLYVFPCFLGTPRRGHLLFRALLLAGTCPMQHWDIPSDPCHQLYLPSPGAEAPPAALPTAVVSICGEGQTWKHLVLLKCGKTFVLQELQAAACGTEWTDQ